MYLSNIKIWNFRKYGENGNNQPGLNLNFNDGLNLLVGENDSGKTAIIDSIKYVLLTQSKEFIGIDEYDFYTSPNGNRAKKLKIECTFSGFDKEGEEAAHFLEWMGFDHNGDFELKVKLTAEFKNNRVITDVKAGSEEEGVAIDGKARDLLRVTYLKPLRDADAELAPGYKSRLAQILKSHPVFDKSLLKSNSYHSKDGKEIHPLEDYIMQANTQIEHFFEQETIQSIDGGRNIDAAKSISVDLNGLLNDFFPDGEISDNGKNSKFSIASSELNAILQKLSLTIEDNKSGLGSLNLLFIATELLLMKVDRTNSLRLLLIEEIEAHLHAQAQLRLIEYFKEKESSQQVILTTHSNILGSKIPLDKLIICKGNKAYPMSSKHTQLENGDYAFLQRFLDATKANLFFARGVIIVEGDAENLLIPTIAELIGKPLHKYGISIVNVGSTAFKRYAKIFLRENKEPGTPLPKNEWLDIPVSIITDLDERPLEYYTDESNEIKRKGYVIKAEDDYSSISSNIEYEQLYDQLFTTKKDFKQAINRAKTGRINEGIRKEIIEKATVKNISSFISKDRISGNKVAKKARIERENNQQNVKVFIAENWTLEYELALSVLKPYYYEAVLQADRIESSNSLVIDDEIKLEIKTQVDDFFEAQKGESDEKIAYKIYKPLMNGNVSKAITAQCLAEILTKNTGLIKDLILETSDGHTYIKENIISSPIGYLIEAIIHATTKIHHDE